MGRQSKKEYMRKVAAYREELRPLALKILYEDYKAGYRMTEAQLKALRDAGFVADNS